MKKYKITYTSKSDGDCCSVWTYARDREDAMEQVRHDYWDCAEIIEVSILK